MAAAVAACKAGDCRAESPGGGIKALAALAALATPCCAMRTAVVLAWFVAACVGETLVGAALVGTAFVGVVDAFAGLVPGWLLFVPAATVN